MFSFRQGLSSLAAYFTINEWKRKKRVSSNYYYFNTLNKKQQDKDGGREKQKTKMN